MEVAPPDHFLIIWRERYSSVLAVLVEIGRETPKSNNMETTYTEEDSNTCSNIKIRVQYVQDIQRLILKS